MGKARAQEVPNSSIPSGKKETGGLGIVFMEIRVVIGLVRAGRLVSAVPARGFSTVQPPFSGSSLAETKLPDPE